MINNIVSLLATALLFTLTDKSLIVGIGVTLLILFHELAHAVVVKWRVGVWPKLKIIPFFGGMIEAPRGMRVIDFAWTAVIGPLANLVFAIPCLFVLIILKDTVYAKDFLALASLTIFFTAINAAPLYMLDGYLVLSTFWYFHGIKETRSIQFLQVAIPAALALVAFPGNSLSVVMILYQIGTRFFIIFQENKKIKNKEKYDEVEESWLLVEPITTSIKRSSKLLMFVYFVVVLATIVALYKVPDYVIR